MLSRVIALTMRVVQPFMLVAHAQHPAVVCVYARQARFRLLLLGRPLRVTMTLTQTTLMLMWQKPLRPLPTRALQLLTLIMKISK